MEIKIGKFDFEKSGDEIIVRHYLAHTTLTSRMGKDDVRKLQEFLTNRVLEIEEDMRIPGVGC
jgi:hypothetical protein